MELTKKPQSFSDSEKLLYMILQELQKLNNSLCPIAKDTKDEMKEGV